MNDADETLGFEARLFRALDADEEALRRAEGRVRAALAEARDEPLVSLSAEWVELLRTRPVVHTMLVAAAAAVVMISLPLSAVVAAASLLA